MAATATASFFLVPCSDSSLKEQDEDESDESSSLLSRARAFFAGLGRRGAATSCCRILSKAADSSSELGKKILLMVPLGQCSYCA